MLVRLMSIPPVRVCSRSSAAVNPRAMKAEVIVAKSVPWARRPRSRSDTRHQGPRGFEARMIFGPSALRPARPQAVHGRAREP
jgi:hypothetical protein